MFRQTTWQEDFRVDLRTAILDEHTDIGAIAALLDSASTDERKAAVLTLGRDEQRRLYQKATAAPAITLDHFVKPDVAARTEVIHHGKNTLPLPKKHQLFQKRFCRPEDGSARLFGYNHSPSKGLIGPGYFVAVPTTDKPDWAARGPVVVDYYQVPDAPVVDGWPKVISNSRGLQFFVYRGTRDYMRRVSAHVSIGAAYKGEKPLDHYFVLCRD